MMEIQTNGVTSPVANALPQANAQAVEARRELKSTVTPAQNTERNSVDDPQQKNQASLKDIENAAEQVNKFISPVSSDLQFSIDKDTGITVVKLVDKTTNEIIRQIPGDEILQIAKALDRLQGLLIKQQA